MKVTKLVLIIFAIYLFLVFIDVYMLNKEHNNGSASAYLTVVFVVAIIIFAVKRIGDSNEG